MNRDLAVIVAGRACQAVLGVAALRVMTALLSPEEAGNYFLVLSFATAFSFFLVNPVGMYMNRRLHSWHDGGTIPENFRRFNLYMLLVAAAALPVTAAVKAAIGSAPGIPAWLFAGAAALYIYAMTWNMTAIPALNMLGYRGSFVALTVLTTGTGLLLSVLLAKFVRADALLWLSGQAAAMAVFAAAGLAALRKRTGGKPKAGSGPAPADRGAVRRVLDFALPLAGATVFMWLQTQGYRLLVELRAGAGFLGYLAVGLGIAASLAAVVESLAQQIYFPAFYRRINSESREARNAALSDLAAKTLPAYAVLLVFTVGLSYQLEGVLVSGRFRGVAPFIMAGGAIEFFRMAGNVLASAAHSEMRTRVLIKPYALGSLALCAGVYAGAAAPGRQWLVPLALAGGGALTLLAMKFQVARIAEPELRPALLLKAAGAAAPLLAFLAFRPGAGPAASLALLAAGGLYFTWLQYLVAFRWTPAQESAAGARAEPPPAENPERPAYE